MKRLEKKCMKKQRIIIDTNLCLSFLISKKLNIIEQLIENKNIEIILSENLIDEIISVVNRPKFKKYFFQESILLLLNFFRADCFLAQVQTNISICRDEKDNFLLDLAIDGKADYLITGDKDLLVLEQIENTKIITMNQFIILTESF